MHCGWTATNSAAMGISIATAGQVEATEEAEPEEGCLSSIAMVTSKVDMCSPKVCLETKETSDIQTVKTM